MSCLNSLMYLVLHTYFYTQKSNCMQNTHKIMLQSEEGESCIKFWWSTFKCVQGINNSLQQITVDTSKFQSENDFC